MKIFLEQRVEAEASGCATLRANGTGCRAEALPKVRRLFEDAQAFRKVRILENPDDFFEGAHPFPRCARKTAHLRRGRKIVCQTGPPAQRGFGPARKPCLVLQAGSRGQSGFDNRTPFATIRHACQRISPRGEPLNSTLIVEAP
jgi:hypothetical protein